MDVRAPNFQTNPYYNVCGMYTLHIYSICIIYCICTKEALVVIKQSRICNSNDSSTSGEGVALVSDGGGNVENDNHNNGTVTAILSVTC